MVAAYGLPQFSMTCLLIRFQLAAITMNIQIGKGNYTVIMDSGSSSSWIGADPSHPYLPSDQSRDIGQDFNVTYGTGNVTGHLCKKINIMMLKS